MWKVLSPTVSDEDSPCTARVSAMAPVLLHWCKTQTDRECAIALICARVLPHCKSGEHCLCVSAFSGLALSHSHPAHPHPPFPRAASTRPHRLLAGPGQRLRPGQRTTVLTRVNNSTPPHPQPAHTVHSTNRFPSETAKPDMRRVGLGEGRRYFLHHPFRP